MRVWVRLLRCWMLVMQAAWIMARRLPQADAATRQAFIQRWSVQLLAVLGVSLQTRGTWTPTPQTPCLIVANHVSWLDVMAIHAVCPQARFVAKAEVHRWPVMGALVAGAGTLFIERQKPRDALRVVHHMADALRAGDTVAVFPEGTTSTGHSLLPFHANLLQAAIAAEVPLQPVVLRYSDERHAVSPAVAYVGDTSLLRSLWWVASARGLRVQVEVLPLIEATGLDRRQLAAQVSGHIAARLSAEL